MTDTHEPFQHDPDRALHQAVTELGRACQQLVDMAHQHEPDTPDHDRYMGVASGALAALAIAAEGLPDDAGTVRDTVHRGLHIMMSLELDDALAALWEGEQ